MKINEMKYETRKKIRQRAQVALAKMTERIKLINEATEDRADLHPAFAQFRSVTHRPMRSL